MVIFHSYVSLPEGTLQKPARFLQPRFVPAAPLLHLSCTFQFAQCEKSCRRGTKESHRGQWQLEQFGGEAKL